MIQNVLILGAGSAGLLAAIAIKRKLPALAVTIVRSSDIGVIGVGEGTTPAIPLHLFDYLQLARRAFTPRPSLRGSSASGSCGGRVRTSITRFTSSSTDFTKTSRSRPASTRMRIFARRVLRRL